MGRIDGCRGKEAMNKGAWTEAEDKLLVDYINKNGEGRWSSIAKKTGLKRYGKSCRLRWLNYMRPDIKRGNITPDEEDLILRLHRLLGNRWTLIAGRLPGRTDNEVKNYWNSTLSKKVAAVAATTERRQVQPRPIRKEPPIKPFHGPEPTNKCATVAYVNTQEPSSAVHQHMLQINEGHCCCDSMDRDGICNKSDTPAAGVSDWPALISDAPVVLESGFGGDEEYWEGVLDDCRFEEHVALDSPEFLSMVDDWISDDTCPLQPSG